MQIIRSRTTYDVCIVGSGAGGGMAAKVLTESGANVVMLEAGPMWNPSSESYMFNWTYDSPRRGAATEKQQFGEFDAAFGGWTLEGEPYTNGSGSQFDWFRSRMLGGRTNHWGRISLRFGPDDFRRKSIDGLGDDWPITYDDMKPYYDRVDELVGIFGSKEGLPNDPDGVFLPPPKPRCFELLIKQAADRLKITCIASRLSIITQPLNGRMACHYCGQCNRGCAQHSNFSSPSVLIPPAMATKKLTIVDNAMAREVTVDETGKATGVAYIDKNTGRENHVQARIVVLAASACESARLLLNSKSAKFPQGLGNSTGNVGKYLTDTTGLSVGGFIPKLMNGVPHNEDGVGGMHVFMPWWVDNKKLDFPRGYHIEPSGGRGMPSFGFMGGVHNQVRAAAMGTTPSGSGYGKSLKDDYRRFYGANVNFAGRGEMIPNKDTYMEIDPAVVDKWGSRCRGSTSSSTTTRSIRRSTCRRPSAPSSRRWAGRRCRRCRRASATTVWPPAAASSTSSASRAWATIRARPCSTRTVRRTIAGTSSSPMPVPSCPSQTRTARGRSSRCRCGRATSSSTSASRGGSNGDQH